ncbi:MAG TPA: LytTR family DNA-binding domain-containing protein [Bacteroidia bacterium]|nr:LytTR family DNA-binding domain-containing protein [Bacteroidia bacterium]
MITCIAIDDEPPALKVIESFCEQVSFLELKKTFTSPTEAIHYLNNYPVDLLFLDINMPSISGIEVFKKLKQPAMVIFTTAHGEYAVEGFNLNAIDFLLKPFSFDRFNQSVKKALDYYNYTQQNGQTAEQFIYIRADYSLNKIKIDDILLIEGLDDYLKIHIKNGKNIVARITMKGILEKLPQLKFKRVHRSFIVPLANITSVRKKIIYLDKIEVPIGNSYEDDFFSSISALNLPQ